MLEAASHRHGVRVSLEACLTGLGDVCPAQKAAASSPVWQLRRVLESITA